MKKLYSLVAVMAISTAAFAQASLPVNATFSNVTSSGVPTMPTGFSQKGLSGYSGSLKFDDQGDSLILQFTGTANALSFELGVNGSFPGSIPATATFTVEESTDGTAWNTLSTYKGVPGGTKTVSTINTATQYIRWTYTTKPSGTNIALKNVSLTNSTLAVVDPSSSKKSLVRTTSITDAITFAAKSDVQIINTNGQVVKSASVNDGTSFDLSGLAKGMYIVTGTVNGEKVSQKIIKK